MSWYICRPWLELDTQFFLNFLNKIFLLIGLYDLSFGELISLLNIACIITYIFSAYKQGPNFGRILINQPFYLLN